MGEVSILRCLATIPGAAPDFAILGPHSEQLLAKWKREVRSLGDAYEEVCYAFLGFTHFDEDLPRDSFSALWGRDRKAVAKALRERDEVPGGPIDLPLAGATQ